MLLPTRHLRGLAARAVALTVLALVLAFAPSTYVGAGHPSVRPGGRPASAPAAQPYVPAFSVRFAGTRRIGHTVSATPSVRPPGATVRYVWLRNGRALAGGTSARRLILLTDTGAPLAVRVTVSRPGYVARTVTASLGTVPRPAMKKASAKSLRLGRAPAGTQAWYTTSNTNRWFQIENAQGVSRMMLLQGWRVYGFVRSGGITAHGVPTSTHCGLPGRGCLTHYTHGTIYTAPKGVVGATTTGGTRGELIAVETSQIGYHSMHAYYGLYNTKYNVFVHEGGAWCSYLHSWSAYYAGLPKVAPRLAPYQKFRAHLQRTGTRLGRPKVGAFALLSYDNAYSHCGLIIAVSKDKSSFEILEGNWGGKVGTRWLTVTGYLSPKQFWDPVGY